MAEKSERAQREEKILSFWKENKIFEKTLEKKVPKGDFIFYEGPPTANGRPGIHHIEARAFKDAIPRYKTMQGYHIRRKAGWDTHGLPVELEVEKQLGLKSKKEIEEFGIAKFNEECKKSVWKYVDEWHDFTGRMGFWMDLEHPYVTYHNSYIESVWSVLAHVEKRKLLYKDYKVVPWCPRCGTALSSHELAQGYQDVKDISLYVKFKLRNPEILGLKGNVYMVAWTTTPWTLPGNVALAVGDDIEYLVLRKSNDEAIIVSKRTFVHKKELFEGYLIQAGFSAEREKGKLEGKDLIGLEYEPPYQFIDKTAKTFKIYSAGFVNTEDGTGIVHTAVMYGQDDFDLGTKEGLPKTHLVSPDGVFLNGTDWLEGRLVTDDSLAVDILKDLQKRNLLFGKENYQHSYPFCWRCKTRLIYYARDSWYIRMSALRDELVKENEKINWEPTHIKVGRFGEWLREVKDWAISRERYWGTPLPVWQNLDGSKRLVIDSLDTLKKYTKKSGNKYFVMRHGEADHNVKNILDLTGDPNDHLTEKGREQIKKAKLKNIDIVFSSPFLRSQESAEIISKDFTQDERLREMRPEEDAPSMRRRMFEFVFDIDKKYKDKNIIILSHQGPLNALAGTLLDTGEVSEFEFVPFPHDENLELDLHRPYIDEIILEKDGEEYKRTKEVMDVWFDSGAVPFAQDAEDRAKPGDFSSILYPADFISEAVDQTRGWFYTLHAVGVLMDRGRAYQNVICLGHILDKEGKKMSKSVGNVVDPWEMMDKYGVDALRLWMYSVNQPGESKNFDERTVDEQKKMLNMLDNVYSFYELYRDTELEADRFTVQIEDPVLDLWIWAREAQLTKNMTTSLDDYQLLEPVRELREFIDDFSTWYLRRSRGKIKSGNPNTKRTLFYMLRRIANLLAPFAPFAAEDLYQKLKHDGEPESIHLTNWPSYLEPPKAEEVLNDMKEVRKIVSEVLMARNTAGIKVRQPLRLLKIQDEKLKNKNEFIELIKDEVNVKEVVFDKQMSTGFWLDTTLTPELLEEGKVRDVMRAIQDMRKEKGLKPNEKMKFISPTGEEVFFKKHATELEKATNIKIEY